MVTTPLKTDDLLAYAAVRLRSSPDWERFLTILQVRASEKADMAVNSGADVVFVNQGKAREAADLLKLLIEAPTLVARLEAKRS